MEELSKKVTKATRWAVITEIICKLISPITTMILARLLTPEIFGIVATVTMIFSFADMFSDAGFQKYLVQKDFKTKQEKEEAATIAFWTNLAISILFWIIISFYSEQLSILVGNPGLGKVFVVSCISLPITSFSSIQKSLFRRNFDFKTLFYARIISTLIPFFVTIPLAIIYRNYWSLIIGTIMGNLADALILTIKSQWKPKFYYSIQKLKEMLSYSLWSLFEAITIWLTSYIGTFIVGIYLNPYYVGLYKTSINSVNQIIALITNATLPVLFATLSRQQHNREEFENTFYDFQKTVGIFIIPLGVGVFIFSDIITEILLGSQWKEAAGFVGLWGLMTALKVIFSQFPSEVYRALGKPKWSVIVQLLQLAVLIPTLFIYSKGSFENLYIARCLVVLQLIVVNLFILHIKVKISIQKIFKNIKVYLIASLLMGVIGIILKYFDNGFISNCFSILVCSIVYFSIICLFPDNRKIIMNYFSIFTKDKELKNQKNNSIV